MVDKRQFQRQSQRKQTPEQRTFAYEYCLIKQINEKTPMMLKLESGEEVSGKITWYDQYAIKLDREPDAPNLVIPKQSILYYHKKEAG